MTAFTTHPPPRRTELVMGPPGPDGLRVVKDPGTGRYYHLGEQEAFLLGQLDGVRTDAAIRAAFEAQFGEPLSDADLGDFLEVAREQGLLQSAEGGATHPPSRRPELVIGPPGPDGLRVVKDPGTGQYYHLGEQETFLFEQLDGAQTVAAIRAA
ncbi:MAG: PqqD family protein, partial [Planctomycetaceae bacterium]|nr:PqqD family protein [Planctomycetaceae bacterium]